MSGLPESGHGWAIYEPPLVAVILTDKLRMHRPLRLCGAGLDSIVLPVRVFSRRLAGLDHHLGPPTGASAPRPPGRVRTGLSLTAGQIPGAPPVGSSDGVPIIRAGPSSLATIRSRRECPATLTEQALWKPVIEQISSSGRAPSRSSNALATVV